MRPASPTSHPHLTPGGVAAAVCGLLLFAWTVRETGLDTILDGIRRVGAGFLAILFLSGVRFVGRAWAWTLCTEEPHRLRIRDTFPAMLSGDALGNVTPLGLLVSEPAKAALVRHRVSLRTALAGIAVENLFYVFTVALVIVGGAVALLYSVEMPAPLRVASLIALGGTLLVMLATLTLVGGNVRPLTRTIGWLDGHAIGPPALRARLHALAALEGDVYEFNRRHPMRSLQVLLLECGYHAAGVAEVWVTLALLAGPVSLSTAFLLESVNRLINVVFKVVPLRLGVDEAGTGLVSELLGLTGATGVTLAIVRKARMLVWTAVGILLVARRGLMGFEPLRTEQEAQRAKN
jgi:uncharacterized membrane protein YbhN (UPF0104 family)